MGVEERAFIDFSVDALSFYWQHGLFSCTYYLMKNCRLFHVPSGIINRTQNVAADYVLHSRIHDEGMTAGLRNNKDNELVAITLLADRKNNAEKHIDTNNENFISKLDITERASSNIIETVNFFPETASFSIWGRIIFFRVKCCILCGQISHITT